MAIGTCITIGLVVGLILTILVYVLVMPKKKDGNLSKFGQFLHDIFRFKDLFIEKVLRFFYVFQTLTTMCMGFFLLFGQGTSLLGMLSGSSKSSMSSMLGSSRSYTYSTFWIGLIVLIIGPIIIRLVYESAMLIIILVTNVKEINKKLGSSVSKINPENVQPVEQNVTPVTPVAPVVPTATPVEEVVASPIVEEVVAAPVEEAPAGNKFCEACGAPLDPDPESLFCSSCGKKVR